MVREVYLFDLNGKHLKKWSNEQGFQELSVSDLEQGIYMLQFRDAMGKTATKSIAVK